MATESTVQKPETTSANPERMRGGRAFVPQVDIVEQEDRLLVLADMSGVKADDVAVDYERGLLTIHGYVAPRQDPEETQFMLQEYGVGDYYRSFHIGEGIDATKIEAQMRDGVLTLTLPKSPEVMPRKISVKTA